MDRTFYCGLLTEEQIDTRQTVCGWVQTKRDMGGVIFIDLRDREGTRQVVFNQQNLSAEDFAAAEGLKNQSVIKASGLMRLRDEETYNPKIQTGTIELMADSLEVLSVSAALPFSPDDDTAVREDLRLKYRFIDLRRPQMIKNLRFRHAVQKAAEDFLALQVHARGREGLPRSQPRAYRRVLRPASVAPDIQAAFDGGRR